MRFAVLTAAFCVIAAPGLLAAPLRVPTQGPAGARAPTASVNFTFLDFPGTYNTIAGALNLGATPHAKSLVVGGYGPGVYSGSGGAYGFLLNLTDKKSVFSEGYETLLPAMTSLGASGVNDAGHIVGSFSDGSQSHGFLLQGGKFTRIDVPFQGAAVTTANGINDAGVIVGIWYTAGYAEGYIFTFYHNKFTQIPPYPGSSLPYPGAINNNGDIAGVLNDSNGVVHGFLLHNGTYTFIDPPGSVYTAAGGLNDSGDVTGIYCTTLQACGTPATGIHGFRYSNGTYTTIDYPGAGETSITDINDQGVMTGFYVDQAGFFHSFLINP
jgi:hypothetical protein